MNWKPELVCDNKWAKARNELELLETYGIFFLIAGLVVLVDNIVRVIPPNSSLYCHVNVPTILS